MKNYRFVQNGKFAIWLIIGLIAIFSRQTYAENCQLRASASTLNATITLQGGNITVGPDAPNGTILFRQFFSNSYQPAVDCTSLPAVSNWQSYFSYINLPQPLSPWAGSPYGGQVYETGIPGIGFVAWNSGRAFPIAVQSGTMGPGNFSRTFAVGFDIYLIKTGPISPGTILGSNLPTIAANFNITEDGTSLRLMMVNFSGAINIVSQTCTTPDVNVQMGSIEISNTFKSINSTSDWKNSSILLTNCPRFYGTLNDGTKTFYSDNGNYGVGTFKNNTISLTITPNTTIVDNAKGIFGIKSGSGSASGIGIQLAYGNIGEENPTPVNFGSAKSYTMTNDNTTTLTLPLVARYIQTLTKVTPGKADATVTFTINYY